MPTVSLSPELELFYICNAPSSDPLKFDHSRPTIVFMHGIYLDLSWLKYQIQDPRLEDRYNLIAFDSRACGRTKAPIYPARDAWVDASDVAVALGLLGIAKCHVFAVQSISVHAAYRFALLYPEMTLSLCLCQLPAIVEFDWAEQAYNELIDALCFPSDIETIERGVIETAWLMFSGTLPPDRVDEICAYWQTEYAATKRVKLAQSALAIFNRVHLTDAMYQRLQLPILVLQGDKYLVCPLSQAEDQVSKMPHGQLFVVKGGPEAFTLVPSCATVVNRVYSTFLTRLPSQSSTLTIHSAEYTYATGLQRLADIFDDPSIAQRPPTASSFSMMPPEKVAGVEALLARFGVDQDKALTALDKKGKPLRRISELKDHQWTVEFRERNKTLINSPIIFRSNQSNGAIKT